MLQQIRDYLVSRDQETDRHAAAMELLQQRGFSYAAARKWLQRHDAGGALAARPRPRRPPPQPEPGP